MVLTRHLDRGPVTPLSLEEEERFMHDFLKIYPFGFLPSNPENCDASWLLSNIFSHPWSKDIIVRYLWMALDHVSDSKSALTQVMFG